MYLKTDQDKAAVNISVLVIRVVQRMVTFDGFVCYLKV